MNVRRIILTLFTLLLTAPVAPAATYVCTTLQKWTLGEDGKLTETPVRAKRIILDTDNRQLTYGGGYFFAGHYENGISIEVLIKNDDREDYQSHAFGFHNGRVGISMSLTTWQPTLPFVFTGWGDVEVGTCSE